MNRREVLLSLTTGVSMIASRQVFAQAATPSPFTGAAGIGADGAFPDDHPLQESWTAWKRICMTRDGRIIDALQNAASHSESQGYGLTLASFFGDWDAFDQILGWTEANLALRSDGLLAWRWRSDSVPRVDDRNNASDGDLFYAWALGRRGQAEGRDDLLRRCRQICQGLAQSCIVTHPDGSGRSLFLPASKGFAPDDSFVFNPSYLMPRAMHELSEISGVADLSKAATDGGALMEEMAATGLVPDWVLVGPKGWSRPEERFSWNCGYEAMRVPLFAAWSGEPVAHRTERFVRASKAHFEPGAPVTVFSRSGEPLERGTDAGYAAIPALADCASDARVGSDIPPFSPEQPYYPATLHLMSLVAQAEVYPTCIPI